MIVVDASAAAAALLNNGPARQMLAIERLQTLHLVDSEIANSLRRLVRSRHLTEADGWQALSTWRRLSVTRYPTYGLLQRIWNLRDNMSGYDAGYVALAETLGCGLITADSRLSNAARIECPVIVVPR